MGLRPDDLIVSLDFADLGEKTLEKQILLRLGAGHRNRELGLGFLALRSDVNQAASGRGEGAFCGERNETGSTKARRKPRTDGGFWLRPHPPLTLL